MEDPAKEESRQFHVRALVVGAWGYNLVFDDIRLTIGRSVERDYGVSLEFTYDFEGSSMSAWERVQGSRYDIFFIDGGIDTAVKPGSLDGRTLSESLQEMYPSVPRVGMSGHPRYLERCLHCYDRVVGCSDLSAGTVAGILSEFGMIPESLSDQEAKPEDEIDRLREDPKTGKVMEEEGF
ncbi:MAG: hypothetical protein HYW25_00160 [Candidatus Aenigmarchaeota archaeon]|nr:hypothetical protein [Candidatus Aenigmarchaeota archaeon]